MTEIHLTDSTFDTEVLSSKTPVLVDFWATWCGPCMMLGPIISEIATEMKDTVKVCKLDVDQNPKKAGEYRVMSIPTVMIFKDGKVVDTFVGVRSKEEIIGKLQKLLENA